MSRLFGKVSGWEVSLNHFELKQDPPLPEVRIGVDRCGLRPRLKIPFGGCSDNSLCPCVEGKNQILPKPKLTREQCFVRAWFRVVERDLLQFRGWPHHAVVGNTKVSAAGYRRLAEAS